MTAYILRRVLYAIPIALGVAVIIFSLVHIAPGDPLSAMVPADAPTSVVEKLRQDYGMDRPLPAQFVFWLQRALSGDLGTSIATGRPVASELSAAVVNTLILAACASMIGFSLGILLGGIAGYYNGRVIDKIATATAVAGVSVPHYWLGMLLVIIFAVEMDLLPAMGMGPGGSAAWSWDWAHMRHLILPAITLSVIPMGIVTRTVRATVSEIMNEEFVETLRAKGMREHQVIRHVAKNAASTVLAVIGIQFGYLLGGSILVEVVFAWPGTGFMLNTAIFRRDLPLLQGTILVLSLFFVLVNLTVDILQAMIDPRMERA